MHQTKYTILIVVLFAAAALIGGYLLRGTVDKESDAAPTPSTSVVVTPLSPTVQPSVTTYKPQLHTVNYTSSGPLPKSLTIRAGDAVRFVNKASTEVWPASDPHPSHSACLGFDAGRGLRTGEEYTLTFPTNALCSYHSHLDPFNDAFRGTITIQ